MHENFGFCLSERYACMDAQKFGKSACMNARKSGKSACMNARNFKKNVSVLYEQENLHIENHVCFLFFFSFFSKL